MKPLLALALLASLSSAAWAQKNQTSPPPTLDAGRRAYPPPPKPAVPRPTAPQEPVRDGEDADAAAIYRHDVPVPPVDVVLSSGELRVDRTDLFIRGRAGMDFELKRRYRSRLDYNGPLGHGWDFIYNEKLILGPGNRVTRLDGRGHVDTWIPGGPQPAGDSTVMFTAPAGWFGALFKRPNGTFVLRDPDGLEHHYDDDGKLTKLEDRHGNQLLFQYAGRRLIAVFDVFGRRIDFSYVNRAGKARLSTVRDFTGREVHYTYNDNGELFTAELADGATETYLYGSSPINPDLNHNLEFVIFPNDMPFGLSAMSVNYNHTAFGEPSGDRVGRLNLTGGLPGGGQAGGRTSFFFSELNAGAPLGDPSLPRVRVNVGEPNGNFYEMYSNELQHQIEHRRLAGPVTFTTRWEHTIDGQMTRLIRPRGNGEVRTYGSGSRAAQRDLVELRYVEDAVNFSSPENDIVWKLRYEPVYHEPVQIIDPRENSPTYVPPMGSNFPGRYTTDFTVDYQEGTGPIPDAEQYGIDVSSMPRGLGDLNGDGLTDQTAGNVVCRADPSVMLPSGSPLALELGSTIQAILTYAWWNDSGQRIREIDPEGNETAFTYHPEDDPGGVGIGSGDPGVPMIGYLMDSIVDPDGLFLRTTYAYGQTGNVTSFLNPRRVETLVGYDLCDRPMHIVRGSSVGAAVAAGELVTGEAAFQYAMTMTYDANGNPVRIEHDNPASCTATPSVGDTLVIDLEYSVLNQVISVSHEVDATTTAVTQFEYGPTGHPTGIIYPEGDEDRTVYDERCLVSQRILGVGSPWEGTYSFENDENGQRTLVRDAEDTDGDGFPEEFVWQNDLFNRVVGEAQPLGYSENYGYDIAGNPISTVTIGHPYAAPAGTPVRQAETRNDYDELNRIYRIEQDWFVPMGTLTDRPVYTGDGVRTTERQFDGNGNVRYESDDLGQVWQYDYDAARRPIRVTDPFGNVTTFQYDANGNVIWMTETEVQPEGMVPNRDYTTTRTYDQLDRLVREIDSDGTTRYWVHDALGRVKETADGRGPTIAADPWGVFPKPGQTGSMNDPGNRIFSQYDGLGNCTQTTYDQHVAGQSGNPLDTNSFNPDGRSTNGFEFDLNRRQTAQIDDEGNRTQWVYNDRGWITQVVLPTGDTIDITYDLDGNERTRAWPNGFEVLKAFDARNRMTSETRTGAPTGQTAGVIMKTLTYDGMDNVAGSSATANSSSPPPPSITADCDTFFDSLGQKREERAHGSLTTSFMLDSVGNVLATTLADDRVVTNTFDELDRPKSQNCSVNGWTVSDAYYVGSGRRMLSLAYGNGTVRMNQFDDRREMLSTGHYLPLSAGGTPFVNNQWTRDRAGNMTSESRLVGANRSFEFGSTNTLDLESVPGATQEYVREGHGILRTELLNGGAPINYNVNQLGAHVSADGSAQSHDELGNQLSKTFFTFTYDQDQNLIHVESAIQGPLKEYYYFADGRLAVAVQVLGGQVVFRYMTWGHGDQVAQEWWDDNGTLRLLRTYYTFNGAVIAIDEEASPFSSDLTSILHQDSRSGVQAQSFLHMADYMANGFWDFNHTDYTGGGLELMTFPTLDTYLFKGLRFEQRFNGYTDDHGGVYFANSQRMGARQPWMPGEAAGMSMLGNGYDSVVSGDAMALGTNEEPFVLREDDKRLFTMKTFEIPRLGAFGGQLPRNCMGTAVLGGPRQFSQLEIFGTLEEDFTRTGIPRVGDLIVFGAHPEGYRLDPEDPNDVNQFFSHVGTIVEVEDGRIGVIGKGRTGGPVELHDARDFGENFSFFRRNGQPEELDGATRAQVDALRRQALFLNCEAAVPVVDRLLFILQERNALDPR